MLVDGLLLATRIMEGVAMEDKGRKREKEIMRETREKEEERKSLPEGERG